MQAHVIKLHTIYICFALTATDLRRVFLHSCHDFELGPLVVVVHVEGEGG